MARQRLRARRRELNVSQETLAQRCGIATTTYGEYERGEIANPRVGEQRRRLAKGLEVPLSQLDWYLVDDDDLDDLPQLVPGWFSFYTATEQTANRLRLWEPSIIPGLLQAEDYALALLTDSELVDARLRRQDMVTRNDDPVELIALIDESVLERPIGGREVLLNQLQHLASMGERNNVEVRIFPKDAPAQPLSFGRLAILSFPWAEDGVAYTEHATEGLFINRPVDVAQHASRYTRALSLALTPDGSRERVDQRIKELQ